MASVTLRVKAVSGEHGVQRGGAQPLLQNRALLCLWSKPWRPPVGCEHSALGPENPEDSPSREPGRNKMTRWAEMMGVTG